jgi:uncharacterized protein (TIGR00290 family)
MDKKIFLSWSGGKDCCMSLYQARIQNLPVHTLLTTINQVHDRISMHGVRVSLLDEQSKALGLPLKKILLPENPGMEAYENIMAECCRELKAEGYNGGMFGDIFLEDLKVYREKQMDKVGLPCYFPLWKQDSRRLLQQFIDLGFKAIIVCVNDSFLGKEFCGRMIDHSFLADLPDGVDPCGENGEYHSFVFNGPGFHHPVHFEKGEMVYREYPAPVDVDDACFTEPKPKAGFYFCDLLPVPESGILNYAKI